MIHEYYMKKITIGGKTLTTRTSEIERRGKRRQKHTLVAILTQINFEEIFRYFKFPKNKPILVKDSIITLLSLNQDKTCFKNS